jgi:NSS family neurotransmitter:Na+ symporter
MPSLPPDPGHEHWGSRLGFVLAAIGSAAGIGNIWRFSYVAGENGGATFLILYLASVALVGLPLVIAELAIGRRAQSDAVAAFRRLAPGRPWGLAGALGVGTGFLILSYYGVIAGWALKYFVSALGGGLWQGSRSGFEAYFGAFITSPWQPVLWQGLMMAATVAVVAGGIQRGIEAVNKLLMPVLGLIVLGLAGFSLTLDGEAAGLRFLFAPDWSAFARPQVYLAAMGQAFFSLGVGMCMFLTYGSYLARGQPIPAMAATVVAGDTLLAVVAGIAIFPAVFAFGFSPSEGPELAFITLPAIFARMPAGAVVAPVFFFLLVAAALTSAASMLEVPVAYLTRRLGRPRRMVTAAVGSVIFLLGVPSALGFGVLRHLQWGGRGVLNSLDVLVSNLLLPTGGIVIALFVGWGWGRANALGESDCGTGPLGRLWLWLLRLVAPAVIAVVLLAGLGLF